MALQFIGTNCVPSYIALSTDIVTSKISGACLVGKLVYTTDDLKWFIINDDLTLTEYAIPATFSGTVSIGDVAIGATIELNDNLSNFGATANAPGDFTHSPLLVYPYMFNEGEWDRLRGSSQSGLMVHTPQLPTDVAISGQITVSTAGTAVQGSNIALNNGVTIKALGGNTGKVYVGNDGVGDVTSGNGFELDKGASIFIAVSNLNLLWFDAATNGDKFCWIMG